ncbi:hypothetical protein [Kiloniella spongiae]|nr:hypothetical protein [Kiloniella spongiae]
MKRKKERLLIYPQQISFFEIFRLPFLRGSVYIPISNSDAVVAELVDA